MHVAQITFCGFLAMIVSSPGDQQPVTIRADVNLVQLHARVTDRAGHSVPDLKKEDFQLFVDDKPQEITVFQGEDAPVTAGIVIDNSASMAPKREEVIAAALAFARASNPKDQMFVVHFNSRARLGLPEGTPFTGNVSELEKAIAAFELGGTTAFYDALLMAESHLKGAYYPSKVLLTLTDGGDNSSHGTLNEVLDRALRAGIVIYCIGIFDENDRDRNPKVLSQIGAQTGGEAFLPEEIRDVTKICVGIAQDIRQQYTLGFPGAEDGDFHRIRVSAVGPKGVPLTVRTRTGYIAMKSVDGGSQR